MALTCIGLGIAWGLWGQASTSPAERWITAHSMTDAHTEKIITASYSGAYHLDSASVQTVLPQSTMSLTADPILQKIRPFDRYIEQAVQETALSHALIYAVIYCESGGDVRAISSKGAKGLMQLMPKTAEELDVNDVFNAQENILAGSRYLDRMLNRYQQLEKALWAYNAGPSNVDAGVMPDETRAYVKKVMNIYHRLQGFL